MSVSGRDSIPKPHRRWGPSLVTVSPGYFRTTGVPILAGREFTGDDKAGSGQKLVVSKAMADHYWPGESALGKCVQLGGPKSKNCASVVGVAGDVHRRSLIEDPSARVYMPNAQFRFFDGPDELIIRTDPRHAAAIGKTAAMELQRLLPGSSPPWIRTMSQALASQYRPWRLGATLFTLFGALALLVAAIGVYSVVAYAVSQRTHEMGVRTALGARVPDILKLVLGESTTTVITGIGIGIVATLVLGRLVDSLLFGVSARDPIVILSAALILGAVGVAASILPALRAARVDPVKALRTE
jgi:putative ABC transport system permease protein